MRPMSLKDYLIAGGDYLARQPEFKLIGRDADLFKLSSILMRRKANSVLLVGAGGVGTTALCLGLQAMKADPNAPFDIVSKRLFWLNTDGLFSSGDSGKIADMFRQMMDHLAVTPDSVLIIEDTKDFITACDRQGCPNFINAIVQAVKSNKTQVILEVRDDDLDLVFKWHSDIRESYTLMDVQEPNAEHLRQIIDGIATGLESHHNIGISDEARQTAIDLTTKYIVDSGALARAQPERSVALLDLALASYRLAAHSHNPEIVALEARVKSAAEGERASLEEALAGMRQKWSETQANLRQFHERQRQGEKKIVELEEERASLRAAAEKKAAERKAAIESGEYIEEAPVARRSMFAMVSSAAAGGSVGDSAEVIEITQRISALRESIEANKAKFDAITAEINKGLTLSRTDVLREFSKISGIATSKLGEDDIEVLKRLPDDIRKRVFGQDHAVDKLANAIKVARIGKRNRDKPQAAFMFLGPSGVGKTEIAKALAQALNGDEKTLLRFDMSEYMEKHAVAKLIGAPPGYEGFEAGGILTNAMRKNRNRIILFDEIEKAHPDVFNIFLSILSDGRLTDNVGRTVTFEETIILMTTNIGQPAFLNRDLTWDEAVEEATTELNATYRAEFLNRFAGRQNIVCFSRLEGSTIERIVKREVKDLDATYTDNGIRVVMPDNDVAAFVAAIYDPAIGARGLPGFMVTNLEPAIVNQIIENPTAHGTFGVSYDNENKRFALAFTPDAVAA